MFVYSPGYVEKYALWYLLPFSSFQKCVGWQGIGFKQTSSPLSPHTGLPVAQTQRFHRNKNKVGKFRFTSTLQQHTYTCAHTPINTNAHSEIHTYTNHSQMKNKKSPGNISHIQRSWYTLVCGFTQPSPPPSGQCYRLKDRLKQSQTLPTKLPLIYLSIHSPLRWWRHASAACSRDWKLGNEGLKSMRKT